MKDAFESLQEFYRECDGAPVPSPITKSTKLFSHARDVLLGGLTPFVVAFSLAAAMIAVMSVSSTPSMPDTPVVFPKMMQSAGLSKADLPSSALRHESSRVAASWHA